MLLGTLAASMLGNMLAGKAKVLGQPEFNSVYSRNNLPKVRDCSYVISLHD